MKVDKENISLCKEPTLHDSRATSNDIPLIVKDRGVFHAKRVVLQQEN